MKKGFTLYLILILSVSLSIQAQVKSGTVEYEELIKFDFQFEGEMAERMRDLPKERTSTKILCFNEEGSLYKNAKTYGNTQDMDFEGERRGPRMMMRSPDNVVYIDLKKMQILEQREFMTRMFLIEMEMPEREWKISGKSKMILDYPCMEATHVDTAGILTRVWFSPGIPVQSGPGLFCGLPGMVLEADINEGSRHLVAISIDTAEPDKEQLYKPKEGKKVTQEEFEKIVAEKMEEMGVEFGPGQGPGRGRRMMIRYHH